MTNRDGHVEEEHALAPPERRGVTEANKIDDRTPRVVLRSSADRWRAAIPWVMTSVSLVVLASLAWFLIENLFWFRHLAFPDNAPRDPAFTLYAFHLHLAMVKRSVGLFAGFALIFIGTAVAFYTLKSATSLEGDAPSLTGRLRTASPGVVAMVLGTLLIMFTIYSKDQFDALPESPEPAAAPRLVQPSVQPQ